MSLLLLTRPRVSAEERGSTNSKNPIFALGSEHGKILTAFRPALLYPGKLSML